MSSGKLDDHLPQAPGRPGPALAALAVIVVVTVGWWALALAPVANAPDWLSRTRLACFGARPGGLPNAGGWILLVGEPIGMAAVLLAVWRDAVWRDLRIVAARPVGRAALATIAGLLFWGAAAAFTVVRHTSGEPFALVGEDGGMSIAPVAIDRVPPLELVDQDGRRFDLRRLASGPVLVTFAFAHCADVCPTLVRDVLRARTGAQRPDIPLVIVTVDPWRDVPSRLRSIATGWALADRDRVLGGTIDEVNAALDAWGIGRSRNEKTGDVLHAATVVLVAPGGQSAVRLDGGVTGLEALIR